MTDDKETWQHFAALEANARLRNEMELFRRSPKPQAPASGEMSEGIAPTAGNLGGETAGALASAEGKNADGGKLVRRT